MFNWVVVILAIFVGFTYLLGDNKVSQMLTIFYFYLLALGILVIYYGYDDGIKQQETKHSVYKRTWNCLASISLALVMVVIAYSLVPAIFSYLAL